VGSASRWPTTCQDRATGESGRDVPRAIRGRAARHHPIERSP